MLRAFPLNILFIGPVGFRCSNTGQTFYNNEKYLIIGLQMGNLGIKCKINNIFFLNALKTLKENF